MSENPDFGAVSASSLRQGTVDLTTTSMSTVATNSDAATSTSTSPATATSSSTVASNSDAATSTSTSPATATSSSTVASNSDAATSTSTSPATATSSSTVASNSDAATSTSTSSYFPNTSGAVQKAADKVQKVGKVLKAGVANAFSFLKRKWSTESEIEEILQRSLNTPPPVNCVSLDCEYRSVCTASSSAVSDSSAMTTTLRQIAMVDTTCTVVCNIYVKDPPGAVRKYDSSAPPSATQVNTVAEALQIVYTVLQADTIIVVHDPRMDFAQLIIDPENVRDTSVEPLIRKVAKVDAGPNRPSLKTITENILNLDIQPTTAHDPVEDSIACMKCYLSVHADWEDRLKSGNGGPQSAKMQRVI